MLEQIKKELSLIIGRLLESNEEIIIEAPKDLKKGDLAAPCFRFAKERKVAPNIIALELVQKLNSNLPQFLIGVEAAGGYVNFKLDLAQLAPLLCFDKEPTIKSGNGFMVEYSQPNTHKAFHVGHLRNSVLGDSIVRILKANGYKTLGVNYFGDEGTHIAKCLWYLKNHFKGEIPVQNRGEFLGTIYKSATLLLEENDGFKPDPADVEEVRAVLRGIEGKEEPYYSLWKETKEWSLAEFREIYKWLGCHFDHDYFESEMSELGKELVAKYLSEGKLIESKGVIGADLEKYKLPFYMLLRSDGSSLYSTKDIALAKIKIESYHCDKYINIVDFTQKLHFQQLFATLEHLGWSQTDKYKHIAYGLVTLADGKMSSRKGNVILFSELKNRLIDFQKVNFLGKYQGSWSNEEIEKSAEILALATIRIGMLKQDSESIIIFNLEEWSAPTGFTGPQLLYAFARIRSILAQVETKLNSVDWKLLSTETEQTLLRKILDFEEVISKSAAEFAPHLLVTYLFQLTSIINIFYDRCSVLKAESEELKLARAALLELTSKVLKRGLSILGVMTLERM